MSNLTSGEMKTLRDKLPELRKGWYAIPADQAVALCLRYADDGTIVRTHKELSKILEIEPSVSMYRCKRGLVALAYAAKSTEQDMALSRVVYDLEREKPQAGAEKERAEAQTAMQTTYNDNDFSTRDIGVVAALMCHGGKPNRIAIDVVNRKAKFTFVGQPEMLRLMRQFHDGELLCNAKQLLNYRWEIKAMVYDKCRAQAGVPSDPFARPATAFRKDLETIPGQLVQPYDFNHV